MVSSKPLKQIERIINLKIMKTICKRDLPPTTLKQIKLATIVDGYPMWERLEVSEQQEKVLSKGTPIPLFTLYCSRTQQSKL